MFFGSNPSPPLFLYLLYCIYLSVSLLPSLKRLRMDMPPPVTGSILKIGQFVFTTYTEKINRDLGNIT